jgi:hypothetical protein
MQCKIYAPNDARVGDASRVKFAETCRCRPAFGVGVVGSGGLPRTYVEPFTLRSSRRCDPSCWEPTPPMRGCFFFSLIREIRAGAGLLD